jgi:1-acyl-sn-glycerol-3-phosphate acyltransferase
VILWELSERIHMREGLKRLYRARIDGAEHVPASGGCVLVANHEAVIDPWLLCLVTERRVRFMAKAELWGNPVARWAMEAYGTFPVDRGTGDTSAMSRGVQLLEEGELLAVFPRGTSKPAGNRIWHRGAARLALAAGAPIVPVRIENTRQVLPRRPLRIVVGEPIAVERQRPTIGAARALTARAEQAVEALA